MAAKPNLRCSYRKKRFIDFSTFYPESKLNLKSRKRLIAPKKSSGSTSAERYANLSSSDPYLRWNRQK